MAGPDPPTKVVDEPNADRRSPLAELPIAVTDQQGDSDSVDELGDDGGVRCATLRSDDASQCFTFQETFFDNDLPDGQPAVAGSDGV